MKELFEQNKLLFLAVITILIAVFLIKKLIEYVQKKGWKESDYMSMSCSWNQRNDSKNLDKGKLSLIT